jgi:hypothetical protein
MRTPPSAPAWQAAARHTESKRPLVVFLTTVDDTPQLARAKPHLTEIHATRADQRPFWQVT